MIKLEYEPYCENCKYFEPEKESVRLANSDIQTNIFCKDKDKCARMYSELERRMTIRRENAFYAGDKSERSFG